MADESLSYCASEVRLNDPERFLTCLFAPAERREALFALYAFNQEIAKTRAVVSEPLLGEIRLTWWREAIAEIYEARPRQHAVVQALAEAVAAHDLTRAHFDRLIETRSRDLEPEAPADLPALLDYADGTAGTLTALCLEALGADSAVESVARPAGIAVALTGLIRAIPFHAREHWVNLPASLLDAHGVTLQEIFDLQRPPGLPKIVEALADLARQNLAEARAHRSAVPRPALAALLPLTLAEGHLRLLAKNGHDVFDARLAEKSPLAAWRLSWMAWRGRY
ncbi:MAG: squalene/phytoene synthase family protein [Alphaproteobacteria bacterium]|nr:squalene/phytoene synthase family protein [Alphaproteobacteria bacterium]MBU0797093.1 squalene/phytoene synthase family protein [Alphaproteobacteria bacterium]MBU0887900.1 squalene/phytoene synthase family protein [Alphaproteobacteria bacterium]MBU1814877.1 squalene/phytoene synthase family protein [Alphaproteobacteria bacterium]MBU2090611.1 squalene/phytoene synthase family protein [Alphaproteobacteria bacterium]